MQEGDAHAVGAGFGAADAAVAEAFEAGEFCVEVVDVEGDVVQAFAAGGEVAGDGAVVAGGGQEFDFGFADAEEAGQDAFVGDFLTLVGADAEDVRVDAFGGVEVAHRDAEVIDAVHAAR